MYVVVVDIYNSLPDNFDMMDGRYLYPLSTVITYTTGAPPRPSRSTKTLEDTQTLEKNDVGLLPPPAAPLPLKRCLGHPKPGIS